MTNAKHDQNFVSTLIAVDATTGDPIQLEADNEGKLLVSASAGGTLVTESFDYIEATYPTSSTEQYVYKSGGSGGATVATVDIVYTSSSKEIITSVTKT